MDIGLEISDIADMANIVIAAVNLLLAGYIFIYQRERDKTDRASQLRRQEQSIKLQWFKELIIQPCLPEINAFYNNLHSIESKLAVDTISNDLKIETSKFVKNSGAVLRKSFCDILPSVSSQLHLDIRKNIDGLVDKISSKIIDAGLNLNDKPTFEREIGSIISRSRNNLIKQIYAYKGI